jgi:L-ascorbate metabolism protein UlaG (beta-lactamase superfamily)
MPKQKAIMAAAALALVALTVISAVGGCRSAPKGAPGSDEEGEAPVEQPVAITYLGQAAFFIECGSTVLMDPYSPSLGYGQINRPAALVTISHEHFDHNFDQAAPGAAVLRGLTEKGDWNELNYEFNGSRLYTVKSFHDPMGGTWLGKNSIFVLETPYLRLVHLGDLGHALGEAEITLIGRTDILMLPVGGYYTLPAAEALQVIEALAPAVVIPMHYRTASYPERMLATLDDFLTLKLPYPVLHQESTIRLTGKELPAQTEIWVMQIGPPE